MIRVEAGMSTARFTRLIGVPERSYRRWQQRERQGRPAKGPWPTPSADRIEPAKTEPRLRADSADKPHQLKLDREDKSQAD